MKCNNSQKKAVAKAAATFLMGKPGSRDSRDLLIMAKAAKLIKSVWKKEVPQTLTAALKSAIRWELRENYFSRGGYARSFLLVKHGVEMTLCSSYSKGTNAGGGGVYLVWKDGKPFIKSSITRHASCGMPYNNGEYSYSPLKMRKDGSVVIVKHKHYNS